MVLVDDGVRRMVFRARFKFHFTQGYGFTFGEIRCMLRLQASEVYKTYAVIEISMFPTWFPSM